MPDGRLCEKAFPSIMKLNAHRRAAHAAASIRIAEANERHPFVPIGAAAAIVPDPFKCSHSKCGKSFSNLAGLTAHIAAEHWCRPLACPVCKGGPLHADADALAVHLRHDHTRPSGAANVDAVAAEAAAHAILSRLGLQRIDYYPAFPD